MRESYRRLSPKIETGDIHLAWVARSACAETDMRATRADMRALLVRARIMAGG
jgi:hypothetical protein